MQSNKLMWTLSYYYEKIINANVIDERQLYALWEQEQLRKLFGYLDVDCVFDIGANEGQYAEMLRRKVGYQGLIISFEPIPRAAEIIKKKAARDPKWVLVQSAVSESDGQQQFNIMSDSQFSSLSKPRHDEVGIFANMNKIQQSITVQTELLETAWRRLSTQYGFQRPFLKMDTQGFDYKIVQAGQAVIRNFVGLQSELHRFPRQHRPLRAERLLDDGLRAEQRRGLPPPAGKRLHHDPLGFDTLKRIHFGGHAIK